MKIKKLSNERFQKTMEQSVSHIEYSCPTCHQYVPLEVILPIYGRSCVKLHCKKCNIMISADINTTIIKPEDDENGMIGTPILPHNVGEAVSILTKAWNFYREGVKANAKRKTELQRQP